MTWVGNIAVWIPSGSEVGLGILLTIGLLLGLLGLGRLLSWAGL